MEGSVGSESPASRGESEGPSAAQRARAERNRLKARVLRDARVAARAAAARPAPLPAPACDTGGGFLLEESPPPPRAATPPPAPLLDPSARPDCLECGRPFAHSYLLETFEHATCDECRDDEGAHALITRTEAKAEYLLRDSDLDLRPPALRCVRRRNPHSARGDMRLYLRAQVEERALLVWGSEEALEEELAQRAERRVVGRARRGARALRALRMDVRSSLFSGMRAPHEHAWLPETYDAETDVYTRACACGHSETYEKM